MLTHHSHGSSARDKQHGQSMTQYVVMLFMMSVLSLGVIGMTSNVTRHQVAAVSHEIAGQHTEATHSIQAAQKNSKYASAYAAVPGTMGTPSSNNPLINPTENTTPAVSNPNPSESPNPVINPITQPGLKPPTPEQTPGEEAPSPTPPPGVTAPGPVVEEAPEPEEILCEKTSPDDDDGSSKSDDDAGFWGSLWGEIKNGLVEGYEFVKGFWEGMKGQIADIASLLAHPVETVKGLIALGKQFYNDPIGTAATIADALGDEFRTLVECGSFDRGRIVGSYISPAFMVKMATKLAKFSNLSKTDLAKALKETKADFGCASFAGDTRVWTAHGSTAISELIKGDGVLSRNQRSFIDTPQRIKETFNRTAPNYYQLTTEFETLKVTPEHPLWKQGAGWTEVQYLTVDDVIASHTGDVLILSNEKIDSPLDVYNFSVENTPSYFVGQSRLWVHNAACSIPLNPAQTRLLIELEQSGVKVTATKVVDIRRTKDGKIIFLEEGSNSAGLSHIIKEHIDDFQNKGITEGEIPNYVMTAVTKGNVVGYQGKGIGRPIYEFSYNGTVHRLAVTVSSNGFIVGANPR